MKTTIFTALLCIFLINVHAKADSILCQDASGNRAKIDVPAQGSFSQDCVNYCDGGYYGDPVTNCHRECDPVESRAALLSLQAYGKSLQTSFNIYRDPRDASYGFYGDTEIHSNVKYEISLRGPQKPEHPNPNLYVEAFDLEGHSLARPLFLNCLVR